MEELDRIRGYLFWEFQYIKQLSLRGYSPEWRDIVFDIDKWEDELFGADTQRYVAHAIYSYQATGECSYPFWDRVPPEILKLYPKYLNFSIKYAHGYYLRDILVDDVTSLSILEHACDGVPLLPPMPFLYHRPENTPV
jgi:hypothetical protein